MSDFEVRKPKIYTDRLAVFVEKAMKEVHQMDYIVVQRQDLFPNDQDLRDVGHIYNRLRNLHGSLIQDTVNGDQGLDIVRDDIIEAFRDVVDRLLETRSFPELKALDELCH